MMENQTDSSMDVNTDADSIESGLSNREIQNEIVPHETGNSKTTISPHTTGSDTYVTVGIHLITALANAYVLSYPYMIMVPLGWYNGAIAIFVGGLIFLYSTFLWGSLCVIDGERFYRMRDIGRKVFGASGYWIIYSLQSANLFFGGISTILIISNSLQSLYLVYFKADEVQVLTYAIIITTILLSVEAVLIADVHSLQILSVLSTVCFFVYILIAVFAATQTGTSGSLKNYDIPQNGNWLGDALMIISALSSVSFVFALPILTEIQATIQAPPRENFKKSITISWSVGISSTILFIFLSYWAFGNQTSSIVLSNLTGPKWLLSTAWLAVAIQMFVVFQLFASPLYEAMDMYWTTGSNKLTQPVVIRIFTRIPFIIVSATLAAAVPVIDDFVSVIGAMSNMPLALVITFVLYISINKESLSRFSTLCHWTVAAVFGVLTLVATWAAFYDLYVDAQAYSLF